MKANLPQINTTFTYNSIKFILGAIICFALFIKFFATPLSYIAFGVLISLCDFILFVIMTSYNYVLPTLLIILSIAVILFNNPIYSLLSLISVFFTMVIFLISIKVEFLAMIFLIIYIGAISILFLFVIMMFNLKNLNTEPTPTSFYFSSYFYIFFILPKFYFIVCNHIENHINNFDFLIMDKPVACFYLLLDRQEIIDFGFYLYTAFSPLFILIGFILLTAMVGAIVLALSTLPQKH